MSNSLSIALTFKMCIIIEVFVERKIAHMLLDNVFYIFTKYFIKVLHAINEHIEYIKEKNTFENRISCMVFLQVTIVLLACQLSLSITSITIYNNAQFVPINASYKLVDLFLVNSQNECICQCFANVKCLTTTYFGINKSCSLFSAQLRKNWLQLMLTIRNASVISFSNKSIPGK